MELRGGEGGIDSKLFVYDLFAAYVKYANSLSLKCELLHDDNGHIIAKVVGQNALSAFCNESGKHVVQRVPPTESRGRRHTSIIVVGILPLPPDNSYKFIPDHELEITTTKGQGPGGQHRNKSETAVRIRHKPTGLMVFICNERSQSANKYEALKIINARINEYNISKANGNYGSIRKEQMADGKRSNKIRTYNFIVSRVVDHRLGTKTNNIKAVMNGKFDLLFK